jgi:hypothetical protein
MKKILAAAAMALICGAVFAQAPGGNGPGEGRMGPMGFMGIEWKIGTVVTGEYKKAVGTLTVGQTLAPSFTVDGVAYTLWLPPIPELGALKTGSSVTVEGLFVTIKSDKPVPPLVRAFKITVDGKEYDVGGPGMMGGPGGMRGQGPGSRQ